MKWTKKHAYEMGLEVGYSKGRLDGLIEADKKPRFDIRTGPSGIGYMVSYSRGALDIAQGLLDALEEEDSAITPGIFPDTEYEYEEERGPGGRLEWVSKTTHHVIVIIADGNFDLYSLDAEADEFFSLETDSFSVAMDFAKTAQGRNNDK